MLRTTTTIHNQIHSPIQIFTTSTHHYLSLDTLALLTQCDLIICITTEFYCINHPPIGRFSVECKLSLTVLFCCAMNLNNSNIKRVKKCLFVISISIANIYLLIMILLVLYNVSYLINLSYTNRCGTSNLMDSHPKSVFVYARSLILLSITEYRYFLAGCLFNHYCCKYAFIVFVEIFYNIIIKYSVIRHALFWTLLNIIYSHNIDVIDCIRLALHEQISLTFHARTIHRCKNTSSILLSLTATVLITRIMHSFYITPDYPPGEYSHEHIRLHSLYKIFKYTNIFSNTECVRCDKLAISIGSCLSCVFVLAYHCYTRLCVACVLQHFILVNDINMYSLVLRPLTTNYFKCNLDLLITNMFSLNGNHA